MRLLSIVAGIFLAGSSSILGEALAGGDAPRTLYLLRCSGCHGIDGSGSRAGRVPGLAGMNKLLLHPEGRLFLANVPGIENSSLTDEEIARLLNWALDRWADPSAPTAGPALTGEEIGRLREVQVDDLAGLRGRIATDLASRGIDIGTYTGE